MIVIVDGLDSAEQRKVLRVLETVHTLFCDPGSPFIVLLAVDPHIIAKVNQRGCETEFLKFPKTCQQFVLLRNCAKIKSNIFAK